VKTPANYKPIIRNLHVKKVGYTGYISIKKGGPLQHEEGQPQPSTALDSFFIRNGMVVRLYGNEYC
jgi:hypothetical protein